MHAADECLGLYPKCGTRSCPERRHLLRLLGLGSPSAGIGQALEPPRFDEPPAERVVDLGAVGGRAVAAATLPLAATLLVVDLDALERGFPRRHSGPLTPTLRAVCEQDR